MAAQICETCKNKGKRCYCPPNSTCGGYEPRKITWFEELKAMNIDKLAEWLDKYGQYDGSPWSKWFDENYCQKCEGIKVKHSDWWIECEVAWCELNDKCKFFQEMDDVPDSKEIVKMWLESEVEESAKTVDDELDELFALNDQRVSEIIEFENSDLLEGQV